MFYSVENDMKDTQKKMLKLLTLEEILSERPQEEVVKAFTSPKVLQAIPASELLKYMPIEVIEEYLNKAKQ